MDTTQIIRTRNGNRAKVSFWTDPRSFSGQWLWDAPPQQIDIILCWNGDEKAWEMAVPSIGQCHGETAFRLMNAVIAAHQYMQELQYESISSAA